MSAIEDARAALAQWDRDDDVALDAILADALRALIAEHERLTTPDEHDCEFGCPSDLAHLQRAYDELKAEYAEFRRSMRGGR